MIYACAFYLNLFWFRLRFGHVIFWKNCFFFFSSSLFFFIETVQWIVRLTCSSLWLQLSIFQICTDIFLLFMCLIVVKVEYFNVVSKLGLLPLEVEDSSIFFFCFWLLVLDLHYFVIIIIIIIIILMRRIASWVNYKLIMNSQIDGVRCRLLDALNFYVPICAMSLIHVCSLLWLTQKILFSLYHQWPF